MQYRKFGKTDEKVSNLGFGCMRLPIINGDNTKIDEKEATKMLHYAIDNGVNYIDTAYPYHKNAEMKGGNSEPFVGKALKDGYRKKVKLATKLPCWMVESRKDMDKLLKEQLERLQTEYIDFYLLHALNKERWQKMYELGILDFLENAKEEGKIRHFGFSFHDELDTFKKIIDAYDWEFCQIQYNYLDENYQAGKEGLDYAAERNIAVIIMEPLRGGSLVKNLPKSILDIFGKAREKKTPAEWALKWIWNHPAVTTVLSGMSTMEQVVENIKSADKGIENSLTKSENIILKEVQKVFRERLKVNCTKCRYCMPCSAGVNIPENFSVYNNYYLMDADSSRNHFKNIYKLSISKEERASNCVKCGKCEEQCPQNIRIISELENVVKIFE